MVHYREVKKLQRVELERLEFKQKLIVFRDPDAQKAGEWEKYLERRKKLQTEFKLEREPGSRKQISKYCITLATLPKKPSRPRDPEDQMVPRMRQPAPNMFNQMGGRMMPFFPPPYFPIPCKLFLIPQSQSALLLLGKLRVLYSLDLI